jgi:hypothetical protein
LKISVDIIQQKCAKNGYRLEMAETISEINKNYKQLSRIIREDANKHFFHLRKSFYFSKIASSKLLKETNWMVSALTLFFLFKTFILIP